MPFFADDASGGASSLLPLFTPKNLLTTSQYSAGPNAYSFGLINTFTFAPADGSPRDGGEPRRVLGGHQQLQLEPDPGRPTSAGCRPARRRWRSGRPSINQQVLSLGPGLYDTFVVVSSSTSANGAVHAAYDDVTVTTAVPEPAVSRQRASASVGLYAGTRRRGPRRHRRIEGPGDPGVTPAPPPGGPGIVAGTRPAYPRT